MFHAQRPDKAAIHPPVPSVTFPEPQTDSRVSSIPALEISGVRKSFGSQPVLRDVSLTVPEGRICGIIGRSGAGKTTLIRIAGLLEPCAEGLVRHCGSVVSGLGGRTLAEARRKSGFVFQNFNLFSSRTVLGNVAFPLEAAGWKRQEIRDRALELIGLVGLGDKANRPASRLSGGERQRVAIARALANRPSLLFCDEATSALDPETTRSILDLIASLSDRLGLTVVMVTHQMGAVRRICGDVAVLAGGTVVERGTVGDVFGSPRSDAARRLVEEAENA